MRGDPVVTLSYSVITSTTGDAGDLLDALLDSAIPSLVEGAGAEVYALWGAAEEPAEEFSEIAKHQVALMLRWTRVDSEALGSALGGIPGARDVNTRLLRAALRGEDAVVPTGPGFYIHRFNLYATEDVKQALSLSERAWVTWEPRFGTKVPGVWRDLEEIDGNTWLLRIAWYEDLAKWEETRDFGADPTSFALFAERKALEKDDDPRSARLIAW
jgi:hypothetical protein